MKERAMRSVVAILLSFWIANTIIAAHRAQQKSVPEWASTSSKADDLDAAGTRELQIDDEDYENDESLLGYILGILGGIALFCAHFCGLCRQRQQLSVVRVVSSDAIVEQKKNRLLQAFEVNQVTKTISREDFCSKEEKSSDETTINTASSTTTTTTTTTTSTNEQEKDDTEHGSIEGANGDDNNAPEYVQVTPIRRIENTCAICLSSYKEGETVVWSIDATKCNHAFHCDCILEWLSKPMQQGACPICRQEFTKLLNDDDVVATGTDSNTGTEDPESP